MAATFAPYTVIMPARLGSAGRDMARDECRPTTQVFVRRRLLVSLVLIAVIVALWVGAGSVLANRGGAPASTSAVRPATTYLVQSGDTMWSIAARFHGQSSQVGYVDALVAVNGGAALQIGQLMTLP